MCLATADFYKEIHEVQQEKHQVSQRTFPKSWSEKELWGGAVEGLAFSVGEGAPACSLDSPAWTCCAISGQPPSLSGPPFPPAAVLPGTAPRHRGSLPEPNPCRRSQAGFRGGPAARHQSSRASPTSPAEE